MRAECAKKHGEKARKGGDAQTGSGGDDYSFSTIEVHDLDIERAAISRCCPRVGKRVTMHHTLDSRLSRGDFTHAARG